MQKASFFLWKITHSFGSIISFYCGAQAVLILLFFWFHWYQLALVAVKSEASGNCVKMTHLLLRFVYLFSFSKE